MTVFLQVNAATAARLLALFDEYNAGQHDPPEARAKLNIALHRELGEIAAWIKTNAPHVAIEIVQDETPRLVDHQHQPINLKGDT